MGVNTSFSAENPTEKPEAQWGKPTLRARWGTPHYFLYFGEGRVGRLSRYGAKPLLHDPPAVPHPSYSRLSRYDCTGLVWLLQGPRCGAHRDHGRDQDRHRGYVDLPEVKQAGHGAARGFAG